jgi:ABC-2 type transport system ATP-binding protein
MTMALRMEGVHKAFRGREVLGDITWSVPTASVCGLIGANGAGKTTLLRLALGLLWPDAGRIEVLGERLARDTVALRERIHYVASDRPMASAFRVEEWLRYARLLYYPRWDEGRARRLVAALELATDRAVGELSAGQRTTLQIAVAVAARPDLLLLDEPTNGLDVVVKSQVLELVLDMAGAQGTTIVIASHHIEDIERLADRLALLYDGRLVLQGELDTIKASLHRVQVVMPGQWPAQLLADPHIVRVEHRGKVALITVEGPLEPMVARCRSAGALLVEPVDLDLTEVFRTVLGREGYSREQLRWDAR